LLIDSSVYCRIVINADDENTVYGIIANKIGRGTHWNINGTFYIEARKNIGEINSCMMFVKDCDGALNIRGVFYLSSPNTNASIFLKIINLNSNGHIIYDGITIMSAIDVIEQNPENNCFICTNATSVGSTMAIHGAVFSYICINNIYMTGINKLFDFGECHSNVVIDGVYSALQSKYG
jgi:hypothetical protein